MMKSFPLVFGFCLFFSQNSLAQSSIYFKTTGAVAFLEYGLGTDRLGGAKMGYLDSNVVVRVVDSVGDRYKVKLSANHHAYIPKSNCRPAPEVVQRDHYLSSSFRVYGDARNDYVAISLDERLPYRSRQTIGPAGIEVDIYGVTSNTNWITQLNSAKEISQTWYEQVEDDVMRVHIRLKNNRHWGHSVFYDSVSNRMFVKIRRQPPADFRKWKIAIDAGHGGDNQGAAGITPGVLEKNYTLLMAKELELSLRKAGVKQVVMTRTTDTTLTMEERIIMLRNEEPQILLSLHLNSAGADTVKGTSTYYRYVGFRPLSQYVLRKMLELGLKEYGNVGSFNFALSGPTEYQNCLVEVAFLSNRDDKKKILSPSFRKAVARKITEGVRLYARTF